MPDDTAPETTAQDPVRETIGRLIGRIPSGLFVLTAADGEGHETGMLASWVQQASFEPPMISVAVNGKRYLNEWLRRNPQIALSLLGESQMNLLKHFARGFEPGEPAFEGIEVLRGKAGLPVLSDSLGYVEGRIAGRLESGDHILYVVEVLGAGTGEAAEEQQPKVHIRKNGFSY